MRLIRFEILSERGEFAKSDEWRQIQNEIREAIAAVVWPRGAPTFAIYPESGKSRGKGNGVKPIKLAFVEMLRRNYGWKPEVKLAIGNRRTPGKVDVVKILGDRFAAVEWETGNVSSSHRALNKMVLGLQRGQLLAGVLVVPTRALSTYLTDRVGNFEELEPYFDLWRSVTFSNGSLAVVAVEHDRTSRRVKRIAKGTDGRALV